MNSIHDDDIDALLRQSFDGPIADDGFCDRVMQQLSRRRRPSAWPLAAGVLVGAAMCSLSLFTSPLWRAAWHGWLVGEWSNSSIIMLSIMAVMSLLALAWTLAEADDH
ncbi:hypothetical protein [Rudaea cellulosilytica]|uniref:hypothetical protein n=1 Tax=Rudaea cellulosilytica TaxID=540746 RepID=UPI00037B8D0E|nr:hypothetical protein [Rudaea cellulosilytica]